MNDKTKDELVKILKQYGPSDPDEWCEDGFGCAECDGCVAYDRLWEIINDER